MDERQKQYRFYLTLTGTRPTVWRRFEVDGTITFAQLHEVIQVIMGWGNQHPYAFYVNGTPIEPTATPGMVNASTTFVGDTIRKLKDEVAYVYDFHDFWDHQLLVEYIGATFQHKAMPSLLAGQGHCPTEDCGGIHLYNKQLAKAGLLQHPLYPNVGKQQPQPLPNSPELNIAGINSQMAHIQPYLTPSNRY